MEDIIKKYINNTSIKNVKKKYKNMKNFSFRPVTTDEVKKVIKDLKRNICRWRNSNTDVKGK